MGFAGFTKNATLANYIQTFFALAPVTTVKHIEGVTKYLADLFPQLGVRTYIHLCVCNWPIYIVY